MTLKKLCTFFVVYLFALTALIAAEAEGQSQKLKLAYVSPSGAVAAPWVAKEAGLKAKVVKAGFVSSPLNLSLIEMGYGVLLDFGRDMVFPFSAFTSRRAAIKQKDQLFRNAIRALAEGVKVYRTQRDFTLKVFEKYTRISDTKTLAQTYDTYAPFLEKVPYVEPFPKLFLHYRTSDFSSSIRERSKYLNGGMEANAGSS